MFRSSKDSICMYTPSADGGHARYAWELMCALHRDAHSGRRFELVSSADLDPQFRTAPYPVHAMLPTLLDRSRFPSRLHWGASRLTHYTRREWQFLAWLKGRPDVSAVHFQEWTPWLAAPLIRRIRAMGKRVFFTCHNVYPHKYPPMVPKAVMEGWIRRGCMACDGLFVLTDVLAAELSRFLGGDRAAHPPIHVVPHGTWTVNDFDPANAPSMAERASWRRLLFFGTIRRNKGLDLLLRAAEHLPGHRITIAGESHDHEYFGGEILPQIAKLRAGGVSVDLIDRFVPDAELGQLFASHSAIVLPYTKGFVAQSGVVFMALAYELPVVASEAGGLRDLMSEFKVGATFRSAQPAALTAAVHELYADAVDGRLIEQMRAAKRRYSWQEAARATIAGYEASSKFRRVDQPEVIEQTDDRAVPTTLAH